MHVFAIECVLSGLRTTCDSSGAMAVHLVCFTLQPDAAAVAELVLLLLRQHLRSLQAAKAILLARLQQPADTVSGLAGHKIQLILATYPSPLGRHQ